MLGKHYSADHLTRAWLQKSPIVSVVSILQYRRSLDCRHSFSNLITDSRFEERNLSTRPGATSKDADLTVEFITQKTFIYNPPGETHPRRTEIIPTPMRCCDGLASLILEATFPNAN